MSEQMLPTQDHVEMHQPQLQSPNTPIGELATVGDFWQWAMSDLLGNRNRGILAEFIVARLLQITLDRPRVEWDCYDLLYREWKIEVKSAAYVQSWLPDQPSRISFNIAPHLCWDGQTNTMHPTKKRWADLYIFSVFPTVPQDTTPNVLDLNHWLFYVTTTQHLESRIQPDTQTIGLQRVEAICGAPQTHQSLKTHVDALIEPLPRS